MRHDGDKRIQTVKAASNSAGYFERSEWEQLIEGDRPDLTFVKDTALGAVLVNEADEAVKPIFETLIKRTAYHLNGNSADVIMAIDQGKIVATGSSLPVSEVELELKRGGPPTFLSSRATYWISFRLISISKANLTAVMS